MSIATSHKTHDRYATRDLDPGLSQSIHNKPKYHLRAGLMYLHQEGKHLQFGRKWAWVGTIEQARAMRRRSDVAAGCKLRSIQSIPVHSEEEA
jgi:hypothetical protein